MAHEILAIKHTHLNLRPIPTIMECRLSTNPLRFETKAFIYMDCPQVEFPNAQFYFVDAKLFEGKSKKYSNGIRSKPLINILAANDDSNISDPYNRVYPPKSNMAKKLSTFNFFYGKAKVVKCPRFCSV